MEIKIKMNKLLKILTFSGMIVGSALALKGFKEDFDYETKMSKENKTELFEKKGSFKDRNNGYEFAGGLLLLAGSLYSNYKLK
jgi:hypothetical protein